MNAQLHTKIIDPLEDIVVDSYKSSRQTLSERRRSQKENSNLVHRRAVIQYIRGTSRKRPAREASLILRTHSLYPKAAC